MLKMVRIATPPWGRGLEITFENKEAEECFYAFAPRLEDVLGILHKQVEQFVNDPEQTFLDEENFPTLSELSGEYYLSSIHYDSSESKDKRAYLGMGVMVRCVGKQRLEDGNNSDYLGLETFAYIWRDNGNLELDEGFNTSAI